MYQKRRSYHNENWQSFSEKVQKRDNFKCLKCGRSRTETILQTHHKIYKPGLKLWEYPLSDCITLCKGCHSRIHGLVEPEKGWTLLSIEDLGGLYGTCERKGCGAEIRYEHTTYHPQWGYKVVGSTCVEYLTQEDQFLSSEVLKIYRKISDFLANAPWHSALTKKGKRYYYTIHSHHQIRIYGDKGYYSFQILLKHKGHKWFDFGDFVKAPNKSFEQVKELGYIVLKGKLAEDEHEKEILRNIYRNIL